MSDTTDDTADDTTSEQITISAQMRLSEAELAEVLALKRVCDEAEGLDLKLGFGAIEPATASYPAVFLARAGRRLVGYCSLDGDEANAELCIMVHPDWRRQRLGFRLFEAARAGFWAAGGAQLLAICEEASTSGRRFLMMLAAQRAFSEHRMVWRAESTPPPPTPSDFSVERARSEDLRPLAEALSHAFDHSEERLLADLTLVSAIATEQVYVARHNGKIIGGFRLSILPDSTGIYAFGIDRAYQRRGWGRQMLAQACALATAQGAPRVSLEVDTDNAPAIALYQSSGFTIITTYGYYIFSKTLLALGLDGDASDAS